MQLVSGVQTAIPINGEVGSFFCNKRGVRQGEPLSPLLFNFVVDAMDVLLNKTKEYGHIVGIVPHFIPGGVTHLHYADDAMILIQNSARGIANQKFLLICFELMPGMKINFHKNGVFVMGGEEGGKARVANLLNCQEVSFPFTYLGFTIVDCKLTIADLELVVAKVGFRMEPWLGRFMSSPASLMLVDACLSNLPIYTMGLFLLQDGTHAGFDKHRGRFFWEGQGKKRKYHMVPWKDICKPRA